MVRNTTDDQLGTRLLINARNHFQFSNDGQEIAHFMITVLKNLNFKKFQIILLSIRTLEQKMKSNIFVFKWFSNCCTEKLQKLHKNFSRFFVPNIQF